MALIKCIECGKEISDKAKICPNCGSPTTFAKEENQEIAKAIIFIVFVGSLVSIPVYFALKPPCLKSAKELLNYPDSMKVISYDRVSKLLTLSAKNGFGARSRVKFECSGSYAYSK